MRWTRLIIFLYGLPILLFLGCNKNDTIAPMEDEQDSSLIFESFILEKKNNPFLSEDVVFDITGNTLTGPLKNFFFQAVPTFRTNAATITVNQEAQTSGSSTVDFRRGVTYTLQSDSGTSRSYNVNILWDNQLPQVNITSAGSLPITSKTEFLPARIIINGQTRYPNFEASAQIRGRGNTTWTYPKKPFKIKLDEEASILGLAPEKDWILLANYLDGTHLLNAVGMKLGQLLELPYTNTVIPVEVTLNGDYLGAYMLTEQIEVKKNRVNVGEEGLLLNLDTNFDEPFQFPSTHFRLPVTIKYPKLIDARKVADIKKEFEEMEALVASSDFPNNNYLDYWDGDAFAKYLIVYMLTSNEEINHPKSTYIYKTASGKYTMGPIWDFDWAFGFEGTLEHFSNADKPLFWTRPGRGTHFFSQFLTDPLIKQLVKDNWADFENQQFQELLGYIDEYAFLIQGARTRDFVLWAQGRNDFNGEVANLKNWLSSRAQYMRGFINDL